MTDEAGEASRLADGPMPSEFVVNGPGGPAQAEPEAPFDPLRLCIFATIALLGWLGGPFTLLVFAAVGFAGYWKARRRGLLLSKCYLRDTRLVLGYLGLLTVAAGVGIWFTLPH